MNRRLMIVLVFATIVGLIASFLVYQVVRQMALAGAPEGTEPVVVAAVNMSMAESVTSQHVKLVQWPKSAIPVGAVRTLANAEGRVVRSAIMAGEPLLESRLAPELAGKGGVMPMLVPEGQRGVSIKVDEAIRESGFILPNSRVDVLVSMTKPGSTNERIAKVILQDVPILAAGQTVEMLRLPVSLYLRPEKGTASGERPDYAPTRLLRASFWWRAYLGQEGEAAAAPPASPRFRSFRLVYPDAARFGDRLPMSSRALQVWEFLPGS